MKKIFLITVIMSLFFIGCMSVPKTVSEDLGVAELNQNAQEYLDQKNYKAALFVYNVLLERHGTDMGVYVAARFEIAHIYIKEKQWQKAYAYLSELADLYASPEGFGLPQDYGKLVQIDLEKIPQKYKAISNN